MIKYHMSRRTFAGAGLASAGLALSSSARAFADKVPTAESALGPFYPITRPADADADLTWVKGHDKRAIGQVIEISGRVFDVKGNPVPGATLELWQANAAGRYDHPSDPAIAALDPNFQGYANIRSDSKGEWRVVTIKPGGYDSPIGHRPPHIHFDFRSEKSRNIAQLYFSGRGGREREGHVVQDVVGSRGGDLARCTRRERPEQIYVGHRAFGLSRQGKKIMKAFAAVISVFLATGASAQTSAPRPIEYFPAPSVQDRPAPFSSAVRVGDVMYLSGAIGITPDGKLPETFDGQAKQTMENIGAALKARGLGWGDVFKCTVFMPT